MGIEEKLLILKQKYFPEHKDKKFENKAMFDTWLKETAFLKICFKDNGQDCLYWWIDAGGEIIHSEMQSCVWNGKIVDIVRLKINKSIGIIDPVRMKTILLDFIVEKIIDLKEKQ